MICDTTPVLLCTTKTYNVLLPVYSVLQSTTPVLQSTMPVLQNTTLVLLCTTKYDASTTISYAKYRSSTTLYYKVLRQYYKVLRQYYQELRPYCSVQQSTTPVLLCTTKYYSTTTKYYASTTKYFSSTTTCYSVLQSTTAVWLELPSVSTLAMLMHANLQHVSLSVLLLGNAFGASAKCLILSAVANAQSAVFLVNMPNKPARPVVSIFRSQWLIAAHCRTEIQIAVAHSSALPN